MSVSILIRYVPGLDPNLVFYHELAIYSWNFKNNNFSPLSLRWECLTLKKGYDKK